MRLSSAENMRRADRRAIEEYNIPSIQLMENASRHLAEAVQELAEDDVAVVFCGSGNNGGDGLGAAVELLEMGYEVRVLLTGSREHATADWREMERRLAERGGVVEDYDPDAEFSLEEGAVIVDAIFGIGLNKPVSGRAEQAIGLINLFHNLGNPVVAADIPSGVEADTGRILGDAVQADLTVTFSMAKPGHYVEPGCACCGKVRTVDIGIPAAVLADCAAGVEAVTDYDAALPRREPLSHKGDYGRLLLLGGSVGYTGAPTLCARAAVRAGAGLVYLGVPAPIYEITAVKNDEAMPFPLPAGPDGLSPEGVAAALGKLETADVCAAGPGLGQNLGTAALVEALLRAGAEAGAGKAKPLVLDADALNVLRDDQELVRAYPGTVVLTPHPGEFLRLGGALSDDRLADARRFAAAWNCVLVLKGHRCIAAFPDGTACVATRGNPGMAKGGSGDTLTGILAALLGQFPHSRKETVCAALQLHALAGDLCAQHLGEYAMTATDLIAALPAATAKLLSEGELKAKCPKEEEDSFPY